MGKLRIKFAVHGAWAGASVKHFIDADTVAAEPLTVPLIDELGFAVTYHGQQVFISKRGAELLKEWREKNSLRTANTPDGQPMVVQPDAAFTDWFMGQKEEDH